MLKAATIGGQSLVFKRYHEVGVTKIRPHRLENPKTHKRILGYDANALYLSTMLQDTSYWKERVVHWNWPDAAVVLPKRLKAETWYVFPDVDMEIPQHLWMKFEEMPPFFFTEQIPAEVVPQHMLE